MNVDQGPNRAMLYSGLCPRSWGFGYRKFYILLRAPLPGDGHRNNNIISTAAPPAASIQGGSAKQARSGSIGTMPSVWITRVFHKEVRKFASFRHKPRAVSHEHILVQRNVIFVWSEVAIARSDVSLEKKSTRCSAGNIADTQSTRNFVRKVFVVVGLSILVQHARRLPFFATRSMLHQVVN